jgi:metal-responsive CopG/Arc/MetJ family transcriptional regulator
MRVRQSLIIEESILKRIDEIAGEKHRRAATIEKALTEFIAREDKKAKSNPPVPPPVTAKSKAIAAAKR